jgi:O-antigen ligase
MASETIALSIEARQTYPRVASALLVILLLGPPILATDRGLDVALAEPLSLSSAYVFHVTLWLIAGYMVLLSLIDPVRPWSPLSPLSRAPMSWYLIFSLFALTSTVYSVQPLYTAFHASKLLVAILLTVYVYKHSEHPSKHLLKLVYVGHGLGWVVLIILYVLDPTLVGSHAGASSYRLTGGFLGDYGTFAMVSGFGLLSGALFSPRSLGRVLCWVFYGLSWVFVLMSQTRSTIGISLVLLVILTGFHPRWNHRLRLLFLATIGGVVIVTSGVYEFMFSFLLRGQDIDAVLGLSGRGDAFTFLIERWRDSPWLGFGFAAGGRHHLITFVQTTGLGFGSPHDAVSKALIDLGIVGAGILAVVLVAVWKLALKMISILRRDTIVYIRGLEYIGLLSWLTLASAVGGGIADVSVPFVIVMAGLDALREETSAVPASSRGRRQLSVARGIRHSVGGSPG